MLAVIAWVYSWWVTAAVPLPVTSMCPKFNRAVVLTVVYATPIGGISTSQFALIQFLECKFRPNSTQKLALSILTWLYF